MISATLQNQGGFPIPKLGVIRTEITIKSYILSTKTSEVIILEADSETL